MSLRGLRENQGLTLLELTLAVAIFAIVIGAAAQALVRYHMTMKLQSQRNVAVQHCRGVLNQIREVRSTSSEPFPDDILAQWSNNWTSPATTEFPLDPLAQEQLMVTYTNTAANPLEVTVTSSWMDLRGRPMTISVSTLLTDE